ncbi:MAG: AMIN domain-containing protein [Persicimonas sp.]
MRLFARCASLAIVVLVGIALGTNAPAQEIRSYGDDGDSSQSGDDSGGSGERGGGWVPGQPEPEQSEGESEEQQTQQKEEEADGEGEGKDEDAPTPSHRVSMYGGSGGGAQGDSELPSTLDMTIDQLYRGVIPGSRDEVAHLKSAHDDGGPNKLTWLGFRPTDDETRIFFQTAREAQYDLDEDRDEARIELTLDDTQIASRNFQRFIDTSYFERNVERVEAREGNDGEVVITIELDSFEAPQIETEGNYVYLKFPYEGGSNDGSKDSDQVADQDD